MHTNRRIGVPARFPIALVLFTVPFVAVVTAENVPVMAPILSVVAGSTFFVWILWLRQRKLPVSEIGFVYVAVVTVYALYPLVGYIVNGLTYTPFNDNRLVNARPVPTEVGKIGWYYVVHLLAFIVVYLLVRGKLRQRPIRFDRPGRETLLVLAGLYLSISVFLFVVDRLFGLSAQTYLESYLIFSRLPPGIAQTVFLLSGVRFTVELALLALLFCYYRKYRVLIWACLLWVAVTTFVNLGSRTELILLLAATFFLYHTLIRPVSFSFMATGGFVLLAVFILLGMLRTGWLTSDSALTLNPFAYASEFETIFANAYHLAQLRAAETAPNLPNGFYLTDLLINVPRQLLPFEKTTPAEWYVSTFYPVYAAQGGGLAFGTVSESLLGWGWLDLAARGAALGFILALIHRYYVRRRSSFWLFVFYIWLDTQIYQSFRNTTFSPLYLFLYRFLWVMVVVRLASAMLRLIPQDKSRTLIGQIPE